jgi:hypothetical protein
VERGAGRGAGAPERDACAAHSGRSDDVDQARSGRGARGFSPVSAAGKRFIVSRQTWRRDDRDGGGRLHAGQTAMPTVAMSTAGRAWGARAVSLQDGAGVRVLAGWRSSTGGRGRRTVETSEGEGEVLAGGLGLPSFHQCQTNETRGKDFPQIPLVTERRSKLIFFLLLVGLQEKEERKRENNG